MLNCGPVAVKQCRGGRHRCKLTLLASGDVRVCVSNRAASGEGIRVGGVDRTSTGVPGKKFGCLASWHGGARLSGARGRTSLVWFPREPQWSMSRCGSLGHVQVAPGPLTGRSPSKSVGAASGWFQLLVGILLLFCIEALILG